MSHVENTGITDLIDPTKKEKFYSIEGIITNSEVLFSMKLDTSSTILELNTLKGRLSVPGCPRLNKGERIKAFRNIST